MILRAVLDGLMVGALVVMAFAACANLATQRVEADVEPRPVPCLSVEGHASTLTGEDYFIVFDQCFGGIPKWVRVPEPPEAQL